MLQTDDNALSLEDINSFYNDVDENLGKHFMIVIGDFGVQIGKRTNPMEMAMGKFGLELRNERGNTLVEWATSRKYNKSRIPCFRRKQAEDGHVKAQMV